MKTSLTLSFALCLLAAPALAQQSTKPSTQPSLRPAAPLGAPVKPAPEIAQAESYFRSLKTVKARFVQTTFNGAQTHGTFYLNRPGKLRFQYDSPLKDFVVADGLFIYFYDGELGQQTNAPISQTLADFLLRKELRLSGDLQVTNITRGGGLLQMTIVQRDEPQAGSITLGFREKPFFELKKWRVKDGQGSITEIELFDTQVGIDLPANLFVYHDPKTRKLNQ